VLNAVAAQPHSSADEIAGQVRGVLGSVSTQAVYDVLRVCITAGLVRRIEPGGGSARYETRIGDNHHHLVCRVCGGVTDVDCTVGADPCLQLSDRDGFTIDAAELVFWGTCGSCQISPSVEEIAR
jgi:Fur family ferric uptake transcriptional regulator